MGFYEKQWLKEFNFCKVLLYQCYFDDIIYLFRCEVDAMKFFDYLNSRHSGKLQKNGHKDDLSYNFNQLKSYFFVFMFKMVILMFS